MLSYLLIDCLLQLQLPAYLLTYCPLCCRPGILLLTADDLYGGDTRLKDLPLLTAAKKSGAQPPAIDCPGANV